MAFACPGCSSFEEHGCVPQKVTRCSTTGSWTSQVSNSWFEERDKSMTCCMPCSCTHAWACPASTHVLTSSLSEQTACLPVQVSCQGLKICMAGPLIVCGGRAHEHSRAECMIWVAHLVPAFRVPLTCKLNEFRPMASCAGCLVLRHPAWCAFAGQQPRQQCICAPYMCTFTSGHPT